MAQVTPAATIIPSNPTDQKVIMDAIKEIDASMIRIDASMIRIDAEKDQIAAIVEEINEKYSLNKGLIKKMSRTYHKQNFSAVEQEAEDFLTAYETIVKS